MVPRKANDREPRKRGTANDYTKKFAERERRCFIPDMSKDSERGMKDAQRPLVQRHGQYTLLKTSYVTKSV